MHALTYTVLTGNGRRWLAIAIGVVSSMAWIAVAPAEAVPIAWEGTINSDWFVPGNWNPASVPGAGDQATINTAPPATAAAPIDVNTLSIGTASGSTGSLTTTTAGLTTRSLSLGTNFSAGAGTATGTLHVDGNLTPQSPGSTIFVGAGAFGSTGAGSGTASVTGNVGAFGYFVGSSGSNDPAVAGGQGTGSLAAGGNLSVASNSQFNVGTVFGSGAASGNVTAPAGVLDGGSNTSLNVGATSDFQGPGGSSAGFNVPGLSSAALSLTRSLLDVGGLLFLGDDTELEIVLDGLLRGTEYGAIDVGAAFLDGALEILVDFAPPTGTSIFDLMVAGPPTSETFGSQGITSATCSAGGDATSCFDAVTVLGLPPGFAFTLELLPIAPGSLIGETLRLTIAGAPVAVPGPAPVLAVAVGARRRAIVQAAAEGVTPGAASPARSSCARRR